MHDRAMTTLPVAWNSERHRLVAERVSHVNRIKGLLATQGIYDDQPLKPRPAGAA